MAEAEELISDAARHGTVFAQQLWRRHRPSAPSRTVPLVEVSPRLDLLISALFHPGYPLRPAQPPAPVTLLAIALRGHSAPRRALPLPATDGATLWLPPDSGLENPRQALELYRTMALQQVIRARRGSAGPVRGGLSPLAGDVYLLLEACAADRELIGFLPGMAAPLNRLRRRALAARPSLERFPTARQPLERLLRRILASSCEKEIHPPFPSPASIDSPALSLDTAHRLIHDLGLWPEGCTSRHLGPSPLLKDWWTGELRPPPALAGVTTQAEPHTSSSANIPPAEPARSARLTRRPEQRPAQEGEDDEESRPSPWMIQVDQPHPHAEDPLGLQRPTDKDDTTGAEEFADMVGDLPQARLVSTPGRPMEILLSDDPPDTRGRPSPHGTTGGEGLCYPEWDYRRGCYLEPGARVRLQDTLTLPPSASQAWVDATLAEHRAQLIPIRKRFEMLRTQRVKQRRQLDGDDIDLEAYTDSYADYRAGQPLAQGLYQHFRPQQRHLAITLLIDISGSTDSWVAARRRVIDVEREALLLVCTALEGLGEPYSVEAFSGDGPDAVTLYPIKAFDEAYSNMVALRISALEPQHYTRTGAALRHATAGLMAQPAAQRLLLLLSDGKPNDQDRYQERYGVEDTRQAVIEARLQGVAPFCLTIDRQGGAYLPRIFGAHHYVLLSRPERLAAVLLDWMKRLLVS